MALYEFKPDDARGFARFMGIKTVERNGNLHFKVCPYCRPTNMTRDNTNTFAIDLKTGAFHCLRASCGRSGNMLTLAADFGYSLGKDIDEYFAPKKQFKRLRQPKEKIVPKNEAIEYLKSRGISEATAERYQITVRNDNHDVLVFPFFDDKGLLQFVKYRNTKFTKGGPGSKEFTEANTKPILYGMFQCSDFDQVILTEGQIDSLSVAEAGINNAVSVPTGAKGFTWFPYCWDWLHKFKRIIVFGDLENGHMSLLDEIKKRVEIQVLRVRDEDYKGCKDANEILQKFGPEQVRKCILSAESLPVTNVSELADAETVDPFSVTKLKTGIRNLDRLLYGGLPFGGVTLITGKPGKGKSTLASQIMIQALAQGYKCFAYSGELPNALFRAWTDLQIAGPSHIYEYTNQWGDRNFGLSKVNVARIGDWYRGRYKVYDDQTNEENNQTLLETIEKEIKQDGAQVILLDNLMTALDLEMTSGDDKYDRQSNFCKKLARLARKFEVLIILVAHKRKNNFTTDDNDEISGSGDIANNAMVTISYDTHKDLEEFQRLLKVSKNRLFGKTNNSGWIMDFDEGSKRIYGDGDDWRADFNWTDGFETTEEVVFD